MTEEHEWEFVLDEDEDLLVDKSFWENVWNNEYEEVEL